MYWLSQKIVLDPYKVLILSDSRLGIVALKKGFVARVGPARLVAVNHTNRRDRASIQSLIEVSNLSSDEVHHIKGLLNVDADKVSRDVSYTPPEWIERKISGEEVRDGLIKERL